MVRMYIKGDRMIIDDCLLLSVQRQDDSRFKHPYQRQPKTETEPVERAIHTIDELAILGYMESMPSMQTVKRVRAPVSMSTRPRMGRKKTSITQKTCSRKDEAQSTRKYIRRKTLDVLSDKPTQAIIVINPHVIISQLATPDEEMKAKALEIVSKEIHSEPVLHIHTAIRAVLQATLDLGRPYDTNMLASTLGVSRSVVMQSLRKYYRDFVEQSFFTEKDFVPTYLWLYGLNEPERVKLVVQAIKLSGASEPGSRSVFAIARDFVILYVSEVVYGVEGNGDLTGLSSVASVMNSIPRPKDVLPCFLDMTNSFLYRARMTGRSILKAKPDLISEYGGTIGGLFC